MHARRDIGEDLCRTAAPEVLRTHVGRIVIGLRQLVCVTETTGTYPEVFVVKSQQVLLFELVEHGAVGVDELVYGLVDELGTIVKVYQGLLDAPPPDHLIPGGEPEAEPVRT